MFKFLGSILDLFNKLFGKIIEDIGNKLYLIYQKTLDPKNKPFERLIALPYIRYGERNCYYGKCYNLKNRDELLIKPEYQKFYQKLNFFQKKSLIKNLILNYDISCYDNCDKFLISLILLFKHITKNDINKIFDKVKNNDQGVATFSFLEEIKESKPKLINKKISEHLVQWKNNFT